MGVATLLVQTPAGAFIDFTRHKNITIAVMSVLISIAAIGVTLFSTFWSVVVFQSIMGMAAAFMGPAIAGLTLGMVGPRYFSRQVGKNEAFNHLGNIVAAALAGVIGYLLSVGAVFYLNAFMAVFAIISMTYIKRNDVNHSVARGGADDESADSGDDVSGFSVLFKSKTLLLFTFSICLFHFANGAMLPLLGQALALDDPKAASLFMSSSIIVAQIVMVPAAILVGRKADVWGRKKIFLIAFLALPVRGILYTLCDNPIYLVSVQVLDGVGAGIFGALFLIVIADLTEGTGRFNITQGAVATIMGVGAAFSSTVAGIIVVQSSYDVAFRTLAGIAVLAFLLFSIFMPETKDWAKRKAQK
jgi:MFS family permease